MSECLTSGSPGVQKQITGAKSGPYDCVVRGVDWSVTWATGKQIKPSDPMDIRERMGISSPTVGATIDQAKRGYESYQKDAAKLGLELGNLNVRDQDANSTVRDADGMAEALDEGHALVLFVWYGKVNAIIPEFSGDSSFSGGHCWTVEKRRERESGGWEWKVFDPLYDGVGSRPEGPQWIRQGDVLACAAAFRKGGVPGNDPIGEGHAIYGIAKRARWTDCDDEPEQGCDDELDAAYDALREVRTAGAQMGWSFLLNLAENALPLPSDDAPGQRPEQGAEDDAAS